MAKRSMHRWLLILVGMTSCAHRSAMREPQAVRACADAAKMVLSETPSYRDSLRMIEDLARRENFDALAGLAEAETKNPLLYFQVRRSLQRLYRSGLYRSEVEDLVDQLYRLAHPPRFWKGFSLDEIKREALIGEVSRRVLKEDLAKLFEELGMLNGSGAREKFRQYFRSYSGSINVVLAIMANASVWTNQIPFAYFPSFDFLRSVPISEDLVERIMKSGVDAAYPDLKRLFGRRADFQALWVEFERFGTYLAYVSLTAYAAWKAREGYVKARSQSPGRVEEESVEESSTERDQRVRETLQAWRKKYFEKHGREPTRQEEEDYARVLRFYGGPELKN